MSIRAARPCLSLVLTAVALSGMFATPGVAQADSLAEEVKAPMGSKLKYALPVPFELDCPHHVNAWSDDTNVFEVKLSGGFTKNPKVTILPKFPGVASLNFDLIGKDQYEGESGDCTGSYMSSVSIRVTLDDKQFDKIAKNSLASLLKSLGQGYKQQQEVFDGTVDQALEDYAKGFLSLDPALNQLNTAYFNAQVSNLTNTMNSLANTGSQLSSYLVSNGASPGFFGGHSQAGAWGRWDQGVHDVTTAHEEAAQDLDTDMWKAWNTIRKETDDPAVIPEFTLVRSAYDYVKGFGVVPPNAGDWVASAARRPATIYYMIGYAKECDPNSGALWAVGLSVGDAALHGEVRIGGLTEEYDFSADSSGVWQAQFGNFGYGHGGGDGDPADPLPSGLARYDVFYEGEADPTNSLFVTIP